MPANKPHMNLITTGHVDHGKSTLVGRLLFDTGSISEENMRKLKERAKELKKETFEFAFAMDSLKEEQERGVTIDIAHKRFDTAKYYFTVIDAPGHRDFVKNMITGASQADAAIIVCSAKEGIQDQTKEHAYLLKILGVGQTIVAINKMDAVNYDQAKYNETVEAMKKLLRPMGYKVDEMLFVPVSAYMGDNVAKKSDAMGWYNGPTLVEALDKLNPPQTLDDLPLRVPIQDVYSITGVGTVPVGRVESGVLKKGQKIIFMPSKAEGEVKSIEMHHEEAPEAHTGDNVGINVRGVSKEQIRKGDVVGTTDNPPTIAKEFIAQIVVLNHPSVMTKGYTPVFHVHTTQVACKIEDILGKVDPKTGQLLPEKPEFLKTGDIARVKIVPTKPLVIEEQKANAKLSKFAIRDMGQTVAAGMCIEITQKA